VCVCMCEDPAQGGVV